MPTIHETVVRLGEQRGAPRYFVNARYLARAGFRHGQWLSFRIGEGTLAIRPAEQPTGKRVQERHGHPLIDLNARFLRTVFGEAKTLHVRVSEAEIILSVHAIEQAVQRRSRDGSFGSVFAGVGFMDEAAKQAGLTGKWAIEIDDRTANAYSDNHPEAAVYVMSAHEAAFCDLPQIEHLNVGLPCAPWSRARTLNSDGSTRDHKQPATTHPLGDMAIWLFLLVARINPRSMVIECAPGFASSETCAALTSALRRLQYSVEARVLDAYDHGALMRRKRTILVALTPSADGQTPDPWPSPLPPDAHRPTFASVLDSDVPDELWWDRTTKAWVFAVNERNAAKGNGFGFQVVTPGSVRCSTLTSNYGETKNDVPVIAHDSLPDTYRYFTVAEGRRLFGLPDHYKLPGAKTFAWRLIGQAVFLPLFRSIIARITTRQNSLQATDPGPLWELSSATP